MEVFLLLVLLAAGGYLLLQSGSRSASSRSSSDASVDLVRGAAEEDVTKLGEEVVSLDNVTAGRELDEATRQDYQQALDSYEEAKTALAQVSEARGRPARHRGARGGPLPDRERQGPARRCAAADPSAAVLLQPAARPVHRRRRVGAGRRHQAPGPGLRR